MGSANELIVLWAATGGVEKVVAELGWRGFLGGGGDWSVVFPADEMMELPGLRAKVLSERLSVPAVWCGTFDDDVLSAMFLVDGRAVAEMSVPDPGEYFGVEAGEFAELEEMAAGAGLAAPARGPVEFAAEVARVVPGVDRDAAAGISGEGDAISNLRVLCRVLGVAEDLAGWGCGVLSFSAEGYSGPPVHGFGGVDDPQ